MSGAVLQVVHYLRKNPVRAGLVNDERAYMWSSANEELAFELDE